MIRAKLLVNAVLRNAARSSQLNYSAATGGEKRNFLDEFIVVTG
jgi:hypothetical protein